MQIVDDVRPFDRVGFPGKGHFRAWRVTLGIREELIEVGVGPVAALGLDRVGIAETIDGGFGPVDNIVKWRTDLGDASFIEIMAGLAGLCVHLAFFHIRFGQTVFYRRDGRRGCAVSGGCRFLRRGKRVAWLDEFGRRENRAGDHIQPHRKEKRSEERSGDFVQFESIQVWPPSLTN